MTSECGIMMYVNPKDVSSYNVLVHMIFIITRQKPYYTRKLKDLTASNKHCVRFMA